MNRRLFLCSLALLASSSRAATDAQMVPHYRLVGYVAAAKALPRIDAEKLTAINFAFARIAANGEVVLGRDSDAKLLAGLVELKARNRNLRILLSIGGWGLDGFSDAALTDASRMRFAESAARLLVRHHLDGVDIDWEYPTLAGSGIAHRAEDKQDFTLLLQGLRTRFDTLAREQHRDAGDPYLITAALADREFVAGIELDRVGRVLDWINLMTYDFHNSLTPTTGHHAALARSPTSAADERSIEHAVAQFLAAGVPAGKLVVGVPFYGRAFADVEPKNYGLDQPYGHYDREYAWSELVARLIDRNGYVRHWDAVAHAPYLWNAQTRAFVSYDDPQSLAYKADFVKARHLGGMMYWEQSQDPEGELLGVLAAHLR